MRLLFWNTKKQEIVDELAVLIKEERIDLAAFSEMSDSLVSSLTKILDEDHCLSFAHHETPGCDRIKVISNIDDDNIDLLNQHSHYSLIKIRCRTRDVILGAVHFPSKLYRTNDDLRNQSQQLHASISAEEKRYGISDSIVMGDFNVDPFEFPMIAFTGMCATNSIDCEVRDNVTRASETKRLFYNPMWTLYSDEAQKPGTFRHKGPGENVFKWHYLDQILMRPSLINAFNSQSLKVVKETSVHKFVGRTGAPSLSDHLPLVCEIEV